MAARSSRVRFLVLPICVAVAVATVTLITRPAPPAIVADQAPRFSRSSETVRTAIAARWDGPIASGSGTRCWEAPVSDVVWRTCDAPTGELMTVSASAPVFAPATVETLITVFHPDQVEMRDAWVAALSDAIEVRPCTTAGPLWRAAVDGRVVVGSYGACPPS